MQEKTELNSIKAALAEKSKTNVWLSETLGVSEITVSRWAQNRQQPTLENLFKAAAHLEVEPCALLKKQNPFAPK